MIEGNAFTLGILIIGLLLIIMTMASSFLSRLPLSAAMLYLGVGIAIGPLGLGLLQIDALENKVLLERVTEIAVLISLFTAGMKLELPLRDRRWRIPVQLATVSMIVTVGLITALGFYGLGLSLGAAVLLGAILAPTDPVLASDVQVSNPGDRDRLRFGLTGEGGLNDGTAFPFVMLGLGLLGVHELGEGGWRWWMVDVLWAITAGLGLGYLLGTLVGRAIIYLRVRHREALRSDEFIALGLIGLTYGVALLCHSYGFLAVFAAGLALRRIDEGKSARPSEQAEIPESVSGLSPDEQAASGAEAPANMMNAVQRFNSQLESFVEVGIVLAVGVLLATVEFERDALWFVPVLFVLVRPLAVYMGLLGTRVKGSQRNLISWFGIRGIGSLYYLLYAINHGIQPVLADRLLSMALSVVVASVIAHGISVTPLMTHYEARKTARAASP
ncbi:cation:proton antiporter [Polaromonas naphthalenivorans]|uniref:Sodium/proton antiporter, CPA1 family n=1 Tax=Polaromonas naphthalenivorans (strain CJ2) TaxID=365044 RepID=A1VJ44_POLNA|nr:cation:proton antiporter [Polaromonas naphthalenivorans]ABM35672.1 sodium/proton antiporter, CPA1 family [Polaromonas naphthalenivorans CJ2]